MNGVQIAQGPDNSCETRRLVYGEAPFLIYWEMTRACDLACRHCRAEANAERDPNEMGTWESMALLGRLRAFGPRSPHLVLTGGDPLKRSDFFDLLKYAIRIGMNVSVAPSATQSLSQAMLHRFRSCGVESISLSLDGSSPERHDSFRGVPGCFDCSIEAARHARGEGLGLQINTLVTAETEPDLPRIYQVVRNVDPMRWSLFYLISVGRGTALKEVPPERCEVLHHWLYELSRQAPFVVATTEAPHYRRVVLERMRVDGLSLASVRGTSLGRGFGIRDGNGIMFISHTGDVYPSGFIPVVAGNIRETDVVEIYRASKVFRKIRRATSFKGRCGRCEFKEICGGSRARAYARSGDFLETDPLCAYEPAPWSEGIAAT